MKNFVKAAALVGTGFVVGYLYSDFKAGRDLVWESDNGIIKISLTHDKAKELKDQFDSVTDEIEESLSELANNVKED